MKKLLFTALCVILILPLYAQETGSDETTESGRPLFPLSEEEKGNIEEELEPEEEQTKKPFTFARQKFEIGFDVGVGFDNDLIKARDVFTKDLVIDLEKLGGDVRKAGFNFNLGILSGLFINIKNVNIGSGVWDFGFFSGADGDLHFNLPKSLFTLLTEGNINERSFNGTISASGGVFANAGLSGSAKYGKLRIGVKPVLFAPLMVMPKSGIDYNLETTDEKISLTTSGQIAAYGIVADAMEGDSIQMSFGVDVSVEGEYELFSFLDVGGSISRIPLAPVSMKNRVLIAMDDFNVDFKGEDLMEGKKPDVPDFEYDISYESANYKIFRPLRFDVYARYKPFEKIAFVVRPNLGFSVSFNDKQAYFNAGAEAQIALLRNMFLFHVGTGIEESVWKQRAGFGFNVRAFELDLEGIFRSQSFPGSFSGQGFGLNLGLRFGW